MMWLHIMYGHHQLVFYIKKKYCLNFEFYLKVDYTRLLPATFLMH